MTDVKTVRLIHWNEDEGLERREQLGAFGFDAAFDFGDGVSAMRLLRASPPDAVVIDLSRMPSHGREVAHGVRNSKSTRHVPIVFVGGDAVKVERTRQLLPDAIYTSWGRIKIALPKAIAKPPQAPVVPDHKAAFGRPTAEKLGAKPGFSIAVLASPKGIVDALAPWPAKVSFTAKPDPGADLFLCFARSSRDLQAHLLALKAVRRQTAWLIWPKKASGVKSDLDGNIVRTTGLAAGWVDFKVCSVTDIWSGLAFKRRK
jgi:CheY-like chemotaxis protein